jgi:hypothetical protein
MVKSFFPNRFQFIYDTNPQRCFDHDRSLSSKRQSRTLELTEYMNGEVNWNLEKNPQKLYRMRREFVKIKRNRLHLLYWTAWAEQQIDFQG